MENLEQGNAPVMQIEINKNDIRWLSRQAKEIKDELDSIQSKLVGILIAVTLGAFGFIGTLLITFLNSG